MKNIKINGILALLCIPPVGWIILAVLWVGKSK